MMGLHAKTIWRGTASFPARCKLRANASMTRETSAATDIGALMRRANKLRRMNRLQDSLEVSKNAHFLNQSAYAPLSLIAEILAQGRSSSTAIHWCKKAIISRPDLPNAYNALQRAASRAFLKETSKYSLRAICVSPENPISYYFFATFLRNSSRASDSVYFYKKAAILFPTIPDIDFFLGKVFNEQDDPKSALRAQPESS